MMRHTHERARHAVLTALVLAALSCSPQEPVERETHVMGTRATVTAYHHDREEATEAAAAALRELHRVESVMSTWRDESEISALNAAAGTGPFTVSRELFSIIDSSLYYARLTNGAFDITARPLVRLWGFQGGTAKLPSQDEIDATRALVGYSRIVLDREALSVTLPVGMSLDLAGIAKGYGVDRSIAVLLERGIANALVNLGGNIYALGRPEGRDGWTIGIRDPKGGERVVGSIMLRDEAVATSGNYENFVVIDGKRYGHIIDPRSGRPAEQVLSVTLVAPTALMTDALSTGLFVLGPEAGEQLAARLSRTGAVFALPGSGRIRYRIAGVFGSPPQIFEPESDEER